MTRGLLLYYTPNTNNTTSGWGPRTRTKGQLLPSKRKGYSGSFTQGEQETKLSVHIQNFIFKNEHKVWHLNRKGEGSPTEKRGGYGLRLTGWRRGLVGEVTSKRKGEHPTHSKKGRVNNENLERVSQHTGEPPPLAFSTGGERRDTIKRAQN